MAQVVDSLRIEAGYVVFGHLHRAGPIDSDRAAWRTPRGVKLVNCGSWVYEPHYLDGGPRASASEHWPGTCVLVGPDGDPRVKQLLQSLSIDELRPSMP